MPAALTPSRLHRRFANGETRLLRAVSRGRFEEAQDLLEKGVAVDEGGRDGLTPLMCAPSIGDPGDRFTRLLLGYGANPRAADRKGNTALHRAADHHKPARIDLLLDAGAGADQANEQGEFPLDKAVYGFVCGAYRTRAAGRAWRRLLQASGQALASPGPRWSALHCALAYVLQEKERTDARRRERAFKVFRELVAAGAHLDLPRDPCLTVWGVPNTPLWEALQNVHSSQREHAEILVTELLKAGAEVEPETGAGYLHAFLKSAGNRSRTLHPAQRWVVRTLVAAGAQLSRRNPSGDTVADVLAHHHEHALLAEITAQRMDHELPAATEVATKNKLRL